MTTTRSRESTWGQTVRGRAAQPLTWLVITYCLLWAVTLAMLPWDYPGLFATWEADYSGVDADAVRAVAIQAWENRYTSVGIPGTRPWPQPGLI